MVGNEMNSSLKILIVDDDKDNAQSLGELFEIEGHHVALAYNGEDAITAYCNTTFDLAFMDVMMPEKNGVESFLAIKRIQPAAKVYMMTGYSVEDLLRQAVREGALGVLEKPYDAAEVLRLARDVGRNGLVLASPATTPHGTGEAIFSALSQNGVASRLLKDAVTLGEGVGPEDVLVIDAQVPLIESVSFFKQVQVQGHVAPTILVPPAVPAKSESPLRDIEVTGILNKPFDPTELISRLPHLAA